MSTASPSRTWVPLTTGLLLGAAAGVLFQDSLPGKKGSPEEKSRRLELELKQANNRLRALRAVEANHRPGMGTGDRLRSIAERLKAGEKVTPDDIFHACQPLMRDLSPLTERIRIHQEKVEIDRRVGELARKYNLNASQQERLKQWFGERAEQEARRHQDLALREDATVKDLIRSSMDIRIDDGLDGFMGSVLSGEQLARFQNDYATEKAERVQQEADMKVQRLNQIVRLDDVQRDQVFAIMARNSRDYDSSMAIEGGVSDVGEPIRGDPGDAIMSVLRADQQAALNEKRAEMKKQAEEELAGYGMSMPENWNLFDELGVW